MWKTAIFGTYEEYIFFCPTFSDSPYIFIGEFFDNFLQGKNQQMAVPKKGLPANGSGEEILFCSYGNYR